MLGTVIRAMIAIVVLTLPVLDGLAIFPIHGFDILILAAATCRAHAHGDAALPDETPSSASRTMGRDGAARPDPPSPTTFLSDPNGVMNAATRRPADPACSCSPS